MIDLYHSHPCHIRMALLGNHIFRKRQEFYLKQYFYARDGELTYYYRPHESNNISSEPNSFLF